MKLTFQNQFCSVRSNYSGLPTEESEVPEEQVPILIVGGGGAGLTASMLLARHGVDHLLISARPGTSDLPKAHVLNQRAMEILEDCGVAG